MSFFSEAANVLGLDYIGQTGGFNIVNYSGEALYLEGIRRIVRISGEEIVFDCKKAVVTVAGERLKIHELEGSSVIIKGRIVSTACEFREPLREDKPERKTREKRRKKEVFTFKRAGGSPSEEGKKE